jgi:hypothetical protein
LELPKLIANREWKALTVATMSLMFVYGEHDGYSPSSTGLLLFQPHHLSHVMTNPIALSVFIMENSAAEEVSEKSHHLFVLLGDPLDEEFCRGENATPFSSF